MHMHSTGPIVFLALCLGALGAVHLEGRPTPTIGADPVVIPAAVVGPVEEQASPPLRLALVVGIDTYAAGVRSFPTLKGCARDVERVREVLIERFEFAPEDIVTLVDSQATMKAIVRAFDEHLIQRAGPETEVVFWFSGHGSRVPDESGRERYGLDSSLVAFDSRAGQLDGSFDLSDDLFASLRVRLTDVTPRVTIVTDACHSGGLTRGSPGKGNTGATRARPRGSEAVDLSLFEGFWPADMPVLEDGDPRRRPVAKEGYVHIAACSPEEEAQEIELEDGQTHGALTFFLTRALIEAQPGTSYETVARDVAARLATRFPGQNLRFKGAADRTLFGARFASRTPGHPTRVTLGGKLSVQSGTMLGVRPGSKLTIHGEVGEDELGSATVIRASAYSALARWDERPDTIADPTLARTLEGALRAIESSRPAGQDPLRVNIALPELANSIEESPLIELVEPAEGGAQDVHDPDVYDILLVEGRVTVTAPDGVRIWVEPEDDAAAPWDARRIKRAGHNLLTELREELTYQSLLRLALGDSALELGARFVPPSESETERWPDYTDAGVERLSDASQVAEASWNASDNVFHVVSSSAKAKSGLAVLEIENTTDEKVFVAVLSVMEDRSRVLVWPHDGKTELVASGKSVRAPIGIESSPSWSLDRPMRDRYLVFATTQYADFSVLNRNASRTRGAGQGALPELIKNALRGPLTRGTSPLAAESTDWGLATVDLLVEHLPEQSPGQLPGQPGKR